MGRESWVICGAVMFYLAVCALYSVGYTATRSVDVTSLVHVGTDLRMGHPGVYEYPTEFGYDGVCNYVLAQGPFDFSILGSSGISDQPGYRHQRMLYPLAVHLLSFGELRLIPYMMFALNLACVALSVHVAWMLLSLDGRNPFYSVYIPLSAGLFFSVVLDLAEPLWILLVLSGLYMLRVGRHVYASGFFALALLAKETGTLIVIPLVVYYLYHREVQAFVAYSLSLVPFLAWQSVMWMEYGTFPLISSVVSRNDPFWLLSKVPEFIRSPDIVSAPIYLFIAVGILSFAASLNALRKNITPVSFLLLSNSLLLIPLLFKPRIWGSPFGSSRIILPLVLASFAYFAESGDRRSHLVLLPQSLVTVALFLFYASKALPFI